MIKTLTTEQTDWLHNLWGAIADRLAWQELAQDVRPDLTAAEWNRAWRCCHCNADTLRDSRREFLTAVNGTF